MFGHSKIASPGLPRFHIRFLTGCNLPHVAACARNVTAANRSVHVEREHVQDRPVRSLTRMITNGGEPRERQGRIVAVRRSVVEVEFPEALPALNEAVRVADGNRRLILEVAYHVDSHTVRTIAMGHAEGLARGMAVERTGFPIKVPVGPETLGRLFDALGQPLDGMAPPNHLDQWPIHRPAPTLESQRRDLQVVMIKGVPSHNFDSRLLRRLKRLILPDGPVARPYLSAPVCGG